MWPWSKQRTPVTINRSQVVDILPDANFIEFLDLEYQLPTDEEFFNVLGFDRSSYVRNKNDCNHYTYRALGKLQGRGWPVFACFIKGTINPQHCIIAYINDKKQFRVVEPQTSMFYDDMIIKYHSIKG